MGVPWRIADGGIRREECRGAVEKGWIRSAGFVGFVDGVSEAFGGSRGRSLKPRPPCTFLPFRLPRRSSVKGRTRACPENETPT